MTNTINFKLSERLNKLNLLDNVETEYSYFLQGKTHQYDYVPNRMILEKSYEKLGRLNGVENIKTLTLEEAIEFLPARINNNILRIVKTEKSYSIDYNFGGGQASMEGSFQYGKTLLERVEKMIEYLLDNNLLTNK